MDILTNKDVEFLMHSLDLISMSGTTRKIFLTSSTIKSKLCKCTILTPLDFTRRNEMPIMDPCCMLAITRHMPIMASSGLTSTNTSAEIGAEFTLLQVFALIFDDPIGRVNIVTLIMIQTDI